MVDNVLTHRTLDPRPDPIPDALAMPRCPKLPKDSKRHAGPRSPVRQACRQLGQVVHGLARLEMAGRVARVHVPGKEGLNTRLDIVLF